MFFWEIKFPNQLPQLDYIRSKFEDLIDEKAATLSVTESSISIYGIEMEDELSLFFNHSNASINLRTHHFEIGYLKGISLRILLEAEGVTPGIPLRNLPIWTSSPWKGSQWWEGLPDAPTTYRRIKKGKHLPKEKRSFFKRWF